jgi:hypothetical protein
MGTESCFSIVPRDPGSPSRSCHIFLERKPLVEPLNRRDETLPDLLGLEIS